MSIARCPCIEMASREIVRDDERLLILSVTPSMVMLMTLVMTFGLASAICGAIGTFFLVMASSAFETPNAWGAESLP